MQAVEEGLGGELRGVRVSRPRVATVRPSGEGGEATLVVGHGLRAKAPKAERK